MSTTRLIIPARGSSLTINKKNMLQLGALPLVGWACQAASDFPDLRPMVTTDDDEIAGYVEDHWPGISVVTDVPHPRGGTIQEVIAKLVQKHSPETEIVILVQPTSPFVRRCDIEWASKALWRNMKARSAQTIAKVPHNFHWTNQRSALEGSQYIQWAFPESRSLVNSNKESKKPMWRFGNVVAARTFTLRKSGFFASPSMAKEIPWQYAVDCDQWSDVELAQAILEKGLI